MKYNSQRSDIQARRIAPAKVNLCLHVLERRPDRYHSIESLVTPIDLTDEIELSLSSQAGIRLACPGYPQLETPSNIAFKTARWVLDRLKIPENEIGLDIRIEKRIPLAAGLGGGSSDAAALIRLMEQLLGNRPESDLFSSMAFRLGADVPVCYAGDARWMEGIGERLSDAVLLPSVHFLLANPGYGISTPRAYEIFDERRLTRQGQSGSKPMRFEDRSSLAGVMHNDLEAVALDLHPDLLQMKSLLVRMGALGALLAGSGPTLFGLFSEREQAEDVAREIAPNHPNWTFWAASNITSVRG